jgi:NAD(P)-dependent dehydrogenase (short-subunit alcohol dehydrogenase family)
MATLKDKVVVLTGASRGIGAATARMLAEDRPKLILCARTAEANAETKRAVEALGATAETHGFDLADGQATHAMIDDVVSRHGHIDVLINNASAFKLGSVAELAPDDFQAVYQVSVMGAYNTIHAALPSMLERGAGTIINLTSVRAFNPSQYWAAICSSKAALISMTQCLHFDVKDSGIRVFAFSPGFTRTDMIEELYASDVFRSTGHRRSAAQPPERPAKVLAWLAREAPEDLAGQHVPIRYDDIGRRAGLEGTK